MHIERIDWEQAVDYGIWAPWATTGAWIIATEMMICIFLASWSKTDASRVECASTGNRTRAARVAGEHSTTEPSMLNYLDLLQKIASSLTSRVKRFFFSLFLHLRISSAGAFITGRALVCIVPFLASMGAAASSEDPSVRWELVVVGLVGVDSLSFVAEQSNLVVGYLSVRAISKPTYEWCLPYSALHLALDRLGNTLEDE